MSLSGKVNHERKVLTSCQKWVERSTLPDRRNTQHATRQQGTLFSKNVRERISTNLLRNLARLIALISTLNRIGKGSYGIWIALQRFGS
jgi:hypothetical protein